MPTQFAIANLTHPQYELSYRDWEKWRYVFEGGRIFKERYLKPFGLKEDAQDFAERSEMTFNAAYAANGLKRVIKALSQRLVDVARAGGTKTYQNAINGLDHGVDNIGSSLNQFIGQNVLPELVLMSKVGVFVDMPMLTGDTLVDTNNKRPYLYIYEAENIRSWSYEVINNTNEFKAVLLRDYVYVYDEETGLPNGQETRYRYLWVKDGQVYAKFYDKEGGPIPYQDIDANIPIPLNIPRIPFILFSISHSLMQDIADAQIAIMNMSSSDIAYCLKANFPFYTEMFDPRSESQYIKPPGTGPTQHLSSSPGLLPQVSVIPDGSTAAAEAGQSQQIKVGTQKGRRYPRGLERPGFINPSSEPLIASMKKQDQLKSEIHYLLDLAVSNLDTATRASADSKHADDRSLEAGLSSIGRQLEAGEREIGFIWSLIEKKPNLIPTIKYPENYSLKTKEERQKEGESLLANREKVPSVTFHREITKQAVTAFLGPTAQTEILALINDEIDKADNFNTDPQAIIQDVVNGLVSLDTASIARGWPKDEPAKAAKDHAARLERIAISQTKDGGMAAARGIPEIDPNPNSGKEEKAASTDTTMSDTGASKVRGKAAVAAINMGD